MAKFRYKALDRNGDTVRGQIDASNEALAYEKLQTRGFDVFELKPLNPTTKSRSARGKAKRKDMARYIRQLATLLGAGVNLLDALKSLSKSNAHPALAKASDRIRADLRAGKRLSQAMETHLPQMPPYVARLAELGESTGQSAKALNDAAERMEFEDAMREEIRTALSYPAFLAIIGTIIVILMFLFVVPRFGTLIGNKTENLPMISKFVIGAGVGMRAHMFEVFAGLIGLVFGAIFIARNTSLRRTLTSRFEKIPGIGPLLVQSEIGGWARTVGIALDNGADLMSSLKLGVLGLRSKRLRKLFEHAHIDIRAGRNIDEVLAEHVPDFDPLSIDLIRTGRSSGNLAKMLLFIGKAQEKETQTLAKRLAALAEPIAILLIAGIVGTIVISIVLAMTSLYDFAA